MSRLAWYWHRLRAMDMAEIALRAKGRYLEAIDARRDRDWMAVPLKPGRSYPSLPNAKELPESLRVTLKRDSEEILAGRWRAFGQVPIHVSDPPEWHKDYLAGVDLTTSESAFKLNHRTLPNGADIKLIWELSRWYQLTRLALAAYALDDAAAAHKCVHWLEHWVQHNQPYRGWNWTSALESGMRLIQFTWIEELLRPFVQQGECEAELERLRYEILPPHVWFTWRHKSFGSSANNHLLGEIAGLILSRVRWPELGQWGTSLDELQAVWEREVLAQFAPDGGNREQALNYHLFSFELCWHTRAALAAAGRTISSPVEERLQSAAMFFTEVQAPADPWDYGDSDSAFVLPITERQESATVEWRNWLEGQGGGWVNCFVGAPPQRPKKAGRNAPARVFAETGILVWEHGPWFIRWDVSPLGHLATAAHGHLDALHLSLWCDGEAMVIDPGTGAYYGNPELRNWLASRAAHNGPCVTGQDWPQRLGPFLWSENHAAPRLEKNDKVAAELQTPAGVLRRAIEVSETGELVVEDAMSHVSTAQSFTVLWQFAPGTECHVIKPGKFSVRRGRASMKLGISADWQSSELVTTPPSDLQGTVSPCFRATTWAPYLKLTARTGHKPCVFSTTFLASRAP